MHRTGAGSPLRAPIDWTIPPGRPDWLFGTGATRHEKLLVWLVVAAALPVVVVAGRQQAWAWWQWLVLVGLTVDVFGGVAANGLGTAKRLYHGATRPDSPYRERWLRHPVAFTAAHVHPFVIVLVFGGVNWLWAAGWYLVALTAVVIITTVPQHVARSVALGITATAMVAATAASQPPGLEWFVPVLLLKLLVAHAVVEEPYRPRTGDA